MANTWVDNAFTLLNVAAASYSNLGVKPVVFINKKGLVGSDRKVGKAPGKKGSSVRLTNVGVDITQSSDGTAIFSKQTGEVRGRANNFTNCIALWNDVKSLLTSDSADRYFFEGETEPTALNKNLVQFTLIATRIDC